MATPEHIQVELPDFASMTDDAVSDHVLARMLDGRWSRLTRALQARFGVEKLELNSDWASTWQQWECPCCRRAKEQIARVSAEGVLLCKLVWHHDHIGDFVKTLLRPATDLSLSKEGSSRRQATRALVFPLVERFSATLVCEDCNNVDGDMKVALGDEIDRRFSFSPDEIRSFIGEPIANQKHRYDIAAGLRAWRASEASFRDRLQFAETLAERVNRGLHDREAHGTGHRASVTNATMLFRLVSDRAGHRSRLGRMEEALWARSRASDGHKTAKAKPASRPVAVPTVAEFAALDAAKSASRPWVRAGAAWACELCRRSKFEIVRKGKTGKFTASVHDLRRFSPEEDPESLAWRRQKYDIPLILGQYRTYRVCQDCRAVVTEAATIVAGIGQDALPASDIESLIGSPKPHARHAIDREALVAALDENAGWQEAARDFWAHYSEASEARSTLMIYRRQLSTDAAKEMAYERYLERLAPNAFRGRNRFDWLVAEGDRLAEQLKADREQFGEPADDDGNLPPF